MPLAYDRSHGSHALIVAVSLAAAALTAVIVHQAIISRSSSAHVIDDRAPVCTSMDCTSLVFQALYTESGQCSCRYISLKLRYVRPIARTCLRFFSCHHAHVHTAEHVSKAKLGCERRQYGKLLTSCMAVTAFVMGTGSSWQPSNGGTRTWLRNHRSCLVLSSHRAPSL